MTLSTRSFFRKAFFACLIFSTNILLTGKTHAQALDTAFVYRITNVGAEGKSLALAWDGTNNRPVMRKTTDTPTQFWKIKKDKYNNYHFVNYRQTSVFSMELVNDADKNKVTLGATKDLASQAWKINSNGSGSYRITCLWIGPEKSLDVVNDGQENLELKLTETGKGASQVWKFTRVAIPTTVKPQTEAPKITDPLVTGVIDTESFYRLSTQWKGEAKSLGIVTGNKVRLVNTGEELSQIWKLQPLSSGLYKLINQQYPDKALDVVNDGKNNNQLTIANPGDYSGQSWKVSVEVGGFYRLTTQWQGDGKSMDILNAGNQNEVILNSTGKYSGQFWKLTKTNLPPPPAVVEAKSTNKNKLMAGEELLPGMKLISANGKYTLIQQTDGNLVLYNANNTPLWASGQNGKKVERCIMQTDGNLVQYLPYKVATWASGTHGNAGAYLLLRDDGGVVIFGKDEKRLWSTETQEK